MGTNGHSIGRASGRPDAGTQLAELARADDARLAGVLERIDAAFPAWWRADRTRALALLAERPSRAAAEAWARLCNTHVPTGRLDRLAAAGLAEVPRHAGVVLPVALRFLQDPIVGREATQLLQAYVVAGRVTAGQLAPHTHTLLTVHRELQAGVQAQVAGGGPAWRWDPAYAPLRTQAAHLLEVLSALPAAIARDPLHEALRHPDPRLQYHALAALMMAGVAPPAAAVQSLAEELETAAWLAEWLAGCGQLHRLAPPFRSPVWLAGSAVAAWLSAPHRLGVLPDAMDFVAAVPAPGAGAECWYCFRAVPPAAIRDRAPEPIGAIAGPLPAPESWTGTGVPQAPLPAQVASAGTPWDGRAPAALAAALQPDRCERPAGPAFEKP